MTTGVSRELADSNWQLPAFKEFIYADRLHDYALVIAGLDEGQRNEGRRMLARIRAASMPVDVIIADGGSTDGSLHAEAMLAPEVSAVLVKIGSGKLSALLRMAYAWCLRRGYQGIITLDGNGGDCVEALSSMVKRLAEGYDYVQGSRYLRNTPVDRSLANRFVHAPLLGLAAGHRFTDTTNGFRAYSRRYLLDSRVKPFRDEFQDCELLYYLAMRAGQIKARIVDVPVARHDPAGGPLPTRISTVSSKLRLLGQTVDVVTGGFTPGMARATIASLIAIITLLTSTLCYFILNYPSPPYSPDSWAYYELSQTVFGDFYRFQHFRTFWSSVPYSSSFPPLFPVLIAVTDEIFSTGARTGMWLAFASFLLFALSTEMLSKRVFSIPLVGLGLSICLLLTTQMLPGELTAGRSIPLQMLIYGTILWGMLKVRELPPLRVLGLGAIAGLAVMNRFDALLLPILLWLFVAWSRGFRISFLMLLGVFAAIASWVVYSGIHFGKPFVTDNSSVVLSLDPKAFVTDWWPVPQPGFHDDPIAWFGKVLQRSASFGRAIADSFSTATALVPILSASTIALLAKLASFGSGRRFRSLVGARLRTHSMQAATAFTLMMLLVLFPQLITGYFDQRYFTSLVWSVGALLLWLVVGIGRTDTQRRTFTGIFLLFAVSACVVCMTALLTQFGRLGVAAAEFDRPADIAKIVQCLPSDRRTTDKVLVIDDDLLASRLGALGRVQAMMFPQNIRYGRLGSAGLYSFLEHWNVRYIFFADDVPADFRSGDFALQRVPECDLNLREVVRRQASQSGQ